jgi:hypothetical protein
MTRYGKARHEPRSCSGRTAKTVGQRSHARHRHRPQIQLPLPYTNWTVIRDRDFITKPEQFQPRRDKVINLCAMHNIWDMAITARSWPSTQAEGPLVRTCLRATRPLDHRHACPNSTRACASA